MHPHLPRVLGFVSADYRKQTVVLQKITNCRITGKQNHTWVSTEQSRAGRSPAVPTRPGRHGSQHTEMGCKAFRGTDLVPHSPFSSLLALVGSRDRPPGLPAPPPSLTLGHKGRETCWSIQDGRNGPSWHSGARVRRGEKHLRKSGGLRGVTVPAGFQSRGAAAHGGGLDLRVLADLKPSPSVPHSPVEIGAAPNSVVGEVLHRLLVAVILRGVGPQQVAHGPEGGGLLEPV